VKPEPTGLCVSCSINKDRSSKSSKKLTSKTFCSRLLFWFLATAAQWQGRTGTVVTAQYTTYDIGAVTGAACQGGGGSVRAAVLKAKSCRQQQQSVDNRPVSTQPAASQPATSIYYDPPSATHLAVATTNHSLMLVSLCHPIHSPTTYKHWSHTHLHTVLVVFLTFTEVLLLHEQKTYELATSSVLSIAHQPRLLNRGHQLA